MTDAYSRRLVTYYHPGSPTGAISELIARIEHNIDGYHPEVEAMYAPLQLTSQFKATLDRDARGRLSFSGNMFVALAVVMEALAQHPDIEAVEIFILRSAVCSKHILQLLAATLCYKNLDTFLVETGYLHCYAATPESALEATQNAVRPLVVGALFELRSVLLFGPPMALPDVSSTEYQDMKAQSAVKTIVPTDDEPIDDAIRWRVFWRVQELVQASVQPENKVSGGLELNAVYQYHRLSGKYQCAETIGDLLVHSFVLEFLERHYNLSSKVFRDLFSILTSNKLFSVMLYLFCLDPKKALPPCADDAVKEKGDLLEAAMGLAGCTAGGRLALRELWFSTLPMLVDETIMILGVPPGKPKGSLLSTGYKSVQAKAL